LKRARLVVVFLCVVCGVASSARAQGDGGPDPKNVRMRLGPVMLDPKFELKNMGVDTNVFNEPEDQNPKSDFTFTVTPTLDTWVHLGHSWLKFSLAEDLVWYQKYSDQRGANENYSIDWKMVLSRVSFTFSPKYQSLYDRPGYEIDARIHHTDWGGTGGVEVRAFPKTSIGFTGAYENITYDPSVTYDGSILHNELDRTQTSGAVVVGYQLTPLTKINGSFGQSRDRFPYSPLRDSDSTQINGNVTFDPHALLKGAATLGFRDFRPVDPSLAPFAGFTAKGDLSYTLLGQTRFQVGFGRDIQYSYDINQPYYLQTSIDGSIAQQIFGPFDAVARAGTAKLAYQDRTGAVVAVSNRVDYNNTYGGGLGYHFSSGLRMGFNVDYYHRITDVTQKRYSGLKYGTSATYDF
jgi:hypothetical protein